MKKSRTASNIREPARDEEGTTGRGCSPSTAAIVSNHSVVDAVMGLPSAAFASPSPVSKNNPPQ